MKMRKNNTRTDTQKYVGIAVFSALAFAVAFVCNAFIPPVAGFLSLDMKDAIIAIASFIYGPIAAVLISFIAAFIEFVTFSTTAWYGFIMNFASSAVFSLAASLIYKRHRHINGALISFFAAIVATTGVMLLLNTFVTPLYLVTIGVPEAVAQSQVVDMLPDVLLPFNFAKALINSAVAMMLYKPVATALRAARLTTGGKAALSFNRNSVIILVIGSVATVVSIAIIIWLNSAG